MDRLRIFPPVWSPTIKFNYYFVFYIVIVDLDQIPDDKLPVIPLLGLFFKDHLNIAHWGKNPQFIQKIRFWKSQFPQNSHFKYLSHFWQNTHSWNLIFAKNSHFEHLDFHKIHIFKISFFTKFTFRTSHFSQNSHSENIIFHKIHILKNFIFHKIHL